MKENSKLIFNFNSQDIWIFHKNFPLPVKDDWSRHEIAWANILHREIFEDGTYFKTVEVSTLKNKHSASKKSRKCRESSEEDEGFEVRKPTLLIFFNAPVI